MELKEATYKLIHDTLLRVPEVEGPPPRLNLICDAVTLDIIGSVCKMSDLYDLGITSVENIAVNRQKLPGLDAFYFLYPSESSLNALKNDYVDAKHPQHDNIHLIFCDKISEEDFNSLAKHKNLAPKITSFREVGLNFSLLREDAFHFNDTNVLKYFNSVSETESVSKKILEICDILDIQPNIRYARSGICPGVAKRIYDTHKASPIHSKKKTTLLIVDRSIDPAAAIMHWPTYETLVYDIIPEFDRKTGVISIDGKDRLLHDSLFETLRYHHFLEVRKEVQAHVKTFLKQNENIAKMQKGDASNLDTKDMIETIRNVPEFQEQFQSIDINMQLSKKVMDKLQALNIIVPRRADNQFVQNAGNLESELATGVTDNMKESKIVAMTTAMTDLFRQNELTRDVKVRLILLFFALFTNVPPQTQQELLDTANLSPEDRNAVKNFIEKKLMGETDRSEGKGELRRTKSQIKLAQKNLKEQSNVIDRTTPRLKVILEKLVDNKLETDIFPGFGVQDIHTQVSIGGSENRNWGWKHVNTNTKSDKECRPTIILFVIGGITPAELRVVQMLRKEQNKCEMMAGGTCILTPDMLLDSLRGGPGLGRPRGTGLGDVDLEAATGNIK